MTDVVLDENIFIFGLESEGTSDPTHVAAARFVKCLQVNHRWVVSARVLVAYKHQFGIRRLMKGGMASELMSSFDGVLFDQDRHVWLHDPPVIPGSYEDRDQHIVSAASAAPGAVLVTSDRPLSVALAKDQIPQSKGFVVMSLVDALAVLCG